jgi:hypothetical protein
MSITVTFPTELEPIVTGRASASGKANEEYIFDLVKRDAALADPWELFADVREQIKSIGTTDEALEAEIDAAVKEVRTRRRA